MILQTIDLFFKNSVVSIPIITFILAIAINNIHLIYLVFGLIISGIINHIIKFTLKLIFPNRKYANILYRPPNAQSCSAYDSKKNYSHKIGFPSGHSQNIWFFVTFLILYMPKNNIYQTLFLIIIASIISFSRLGYYIKLGSPCHTPLQVFSGSLLGIILSYYYFFKFDFITQLLFPTIYVN